VAPRPPADPAKLLATWMEWERGEAAPGRVLATLKTGGLRTLLEELARATTPAATGLPDPPSPAKTSEPARPFVPGAGSDPLLR
jgi:hypothetical protein